MINNLIHTNVQLHDGSSLHQHQTKSKIIIRKPKVKSKYFGTSAIASKSISSFNELPEEMKKARDLFTFKKMMKMHLNSC